MKEVEINKVIKLTYRLPDHVPTRSYLGLTEYCADKGLDPGEYRLETEIMDSQIVAVKVADCKVCFGDVVCNRCGRLQDEIV